jgi:hypothetical protein
MSIRTRLRKAASRVLDSDESLDVAFPAAKMNPRALGCMTMLILFALGIGIGAGLTIASPPLRIAIAAVVGAFVVRVLLLPLTRLIVVSNRRILICTGSRVPFTRSLRVQRVLPRETRIGPTSSRSWKCKSLGERLVVDFNYLDEVDKADAIEDQRLKEG